MSCETNLIHLYTDGACSGNPGPAGVGVLMRYKDQERKISKYLGNATNNIAELTAVKVALEAVKNRTIPIIIYTDSQYTIGVLGNWKAKKNVELVGEIKRLMSDFTKITFVWVRGHSGNTENEIVDKLAVSAYVDKKDLDFKT
jgi:ribonuclease HI